MSAQVAADLRAAADVLERDGWIQGRSHAYDKETGTHGWCAVGALRHVVQDRTEPNRYGEAYRQLMLTVSISPAVWNDRPERTAAEVVAALRAAADKADQS